MTITLNADQEQAVQNAIRAGQVSSVEELIDLALAGLGSNLGNGDLTVADCSIFEQGLGLFSSPEDAALLDDVVTLAYEERRHPSMQEPLL